MHHDLAMNNILVCQDGSWKLADFGIAKIATQGGQLSETENRGHRQSLPMSLAVGARWEARKYTPELEDEIGSLGVILHSFLSSGKHYSLGDTSSDAFRWDHAKQQYERKSKSERLIELFELKHFPRAIDGGGGTRNYAYTDGMDLLLMLLNDEDRCSLDEARQHPLLRTDAEVMDLLEQLCNFFNDKSVAISSTTSPLKFRVMQSLELYRKGDEKSNREVTFVIASLPFGLRQLHTENRHFGYLDLVVGRDAAKARNTEFDRYGWSSTLPTTVANSLHGLHR
mmetsp:Transcript_72015/g.216510  ORF Transcript_72015/g.216510 Transcript_72015/m.216510 type:complete len:283 (-) Transcript_72015:664-1512(-)